MSKCPKEDFSAVLKLLEETGLVPWTAVKLCANEGNKSVVK